MNHNSTDTYTQLEWFLFNTFMEKSNDIVMITDSGNSLDDACVLGVNTFFELNTGLTQVRLINSPFAEWINLSVNQRNRLNIAFTDRSSLKLELAVKKTGNNFTHIEFEIYPIKQATNFWVWQGKLLEQKTSHSQQLIQQKELSAMQPIAAQTAHDFNNILAVIMGNNDLLLENIEVSSPFYPLLQSISRSIDKGTELTKNLQVFAQKKPQTNADVN